MEVLSTNVKLLIIINIFSIFSLSRVYFWDISFYMIIFKQKTRININSRKKISARNSIQYCSYHNGYDTIKYCKLSKLYRRNCLSKIHLLLRETKRLGSSSSVSFFPPRIPAAFRRLRTVLKLMAIAQLYSEELRKRKRSRFSSLRRRSTRPSRGFRSGRSSSRGCLAPFSVHASETSSFSCVHV